MTKALLIVELVIVFGGLPLALWLRWLKVPPIPLLLLMALFAFLILRFDPGFDRGKLTAPPAGMQSVILRTLALCAVIGIGVWIFQPDKLFVFVRRTPLLWAAVMLLYPIVSVYPQELIFRAYFFHRYRPLFPSDLTMIVASALAFGFVHIIFGNWLSVVLCIVGGVIFSMTYLQTGSLIAASIEHALFGDFIFIIGLGEYFYHGTRRLMNQ